ncbi:hypothetical protein Lser_V15G22940 [Lactuca serriola]
MSSSSPTRKNTRIRSSLIHNLLALLCVVFASYAITLRNEVRKLQEDNYDLHRTCLNKYIPHDEIMEIFKHESDTDRRNFALYTVLFTLVTPFVLYKYLDDLPKIKNLSKRSNNNKQEVPLKKRIGYMVDVCFSIYPYAKLHALLFATIFLIAFGGLALYAVSDGSLAEALWLSWTFMADSGNHADIVGTGSRIILVSISSGRMLIFAMMLGLVSDAILEKVDSLRKGKSEVIESNHILVLGWSDKLGSLLKQLAIANKSIGGGVVVVLSERDKEEMEMDIAKLKFSFMGTSVICRSGSPLILADLKKVMSDVNQVITALLNHLTRGYTPCIVDNKVKIPEQYFQGKEDKNKKNKKRKKEVVELCFVVREDEEMLTCGNESGSIGCGVVMASQRLQLWERIVPVVTELLVAHFIWLDYDNPAKPIYLYINSSGTQNDKMETVRSETEAYAIVDIMAVYKVQFGL